jgi:hypothetical protein
MPEASGLSVASRPFARLDPNAQDHLRGRRCPWRPPEGGLLPTVPLSRTSQTSASTTHRVVRKAAVSRWWLRDTRIDRAAAFLPASPHTNGGAGRSVCFAMERSRPLRLTEEDARHLLGQTSLTRPATPRPCGPPPSTCRRGCIGSAARCCPAGIRRPAGQPAVPRFLAFVPHARLRWLPGLSRVPVFDDPRPVARLTIHFLTAQTPAAA